jgi:hypothetical protein
MGKDQGFTIWVAVRGKKGGTDPNFIVWMESVGLKSLYIGYNFVCADIKN